MFYSSFHIEIPFFFRDFENIEKWLQFFETILDLPSDPILVKNQDGCEDLLEVFHTLC